MSDFRPSQYDAYAPPVLTQKRGTSPWVYVSFGCGFLLLLGFGGCAAFIMTVRNQIGDLPKTPAAVVANLKDTPIYPNATPDMKHIGNAAGMAVGERIALGADSAAGGSFTTPDDMAKVDAWYATTLSGLGFEPLANGVSSMKMYGHEHEIVIVAEATANASTPGTKFNVIRVFGAKRVPRMGK